MVGHKLHIQDAKVFFPQQSAERLLCTPSSTGGDRNFPPILRSEDDMVLATVCQMRRMMISFFSTWIIHHSSIEANYQVLTLNYYTTIS